MKIKDKLLIILLIILIIIFLLIILLKNTVNYKDNEKKEEDNVVKVENEGIIQVSNDDVIKDREISGVLFSDISYIYTGKDTIITLDITNKNLETIERLRFEFSVYDKNNNLLGSFNGAYEKNIANNYKLNDLLFGTDKDLSDAYSMDIVITELNFINEE